MGEGWGEGAKLARYFTLTLALPRQGGGEIRLVETRMEWRNNEIMGRNETQKLTSNLFSIFQSSIIPVFQQSV
jgi:hypothetical protein